MNENRSELSTLTFLPFKTKQKTLKSNYFHKLPPKCDSNSKVVILSYCLWEAMWPTKPDETRPSIDTFARPAIQHKKQNKNEKLKQKITLDTRTIQDTAIMGGTEQGPSCGV